MKKLMLLMIVALLALTSCKNDDDIDTGFIPARDRGEVAPEATAEIETYLDTHFYNYEEFENPPAGFNFRIKFDTIAGDNSAKIPLRQQVSTRTVKDRVKEGLTYSLYFLKVREGEGETVSFPDITTLTYEGTSLFENETEIFDGSNIPVRFDLTSVVNGFQDVLQEFRTATSSQNNPDGTVSFENYGIGAVFMQSGLGYYVSPPQGSNIPLYSQLIFTFQLFDREIGDQDEDGILSINEDLNQNGFEEDDDTDADGIPNFADVDDDNDGRLTRDEIIINADGTITFPDVDGDGIPDYLDSDS